MTPNSHTSDDGAFLVATAGANPIDADSWSAPDHQSTAYQTPLAFQSDALGMISKFPDEAGVGMNAYDRDPSGWAAKEDWARHQALIKQLYLYEKKPLKEVMRYMEDQYDFRATTKMYKTHIQQWGLDKKIKDVEMRAVVRKNKQRADQGKSSTIHVRGQHRGLEDFIRHCNRKGVSIDDIIARHTSSPTPDTVELFTPVPSRVSTPQVLEVPERMFLCIRDYLSGSFEAGNLVRTVPFKPCYSTKCGEEADFHAQNLFFQCEAACTLFSSNAIEEGGRILIAAFGRIKRILSEDPPQTIFNILRLISRLRFLNRDEIAFILLRYLSDLSDLLLGGEHPLKRVFGWCKLLHASDFDDIATRCVEGTADHFESFVGAMHKSTLEFRRRSNDFPTREGANRIQKTQRLLSDCEGKLQPDDIRTFSTRDCLAYEYHRQSYHVEAMTLSLESFANSQHIPSESIRKHFETQSLRIIAVCQYDLGEVDLGIANLNEAIDSRISVWGPQDTIAGYWLVDLEDWLLRQGDWDYAEKTRDYRMRTLFWIMTSKFGGNDYLHYSGSLGLGLFPRRYS